ncbi:MAG: glycosyltransferase family 4 protein [Cytophagaceae bacterium]
MQTKVIYIISNLDKSKGFEWTSLHLDKSRFELVFILLNSGPTDLERFLKRNKFKVYTFKLQSKFSLIISFVRTVICLIKEKPNAVHCHLFEASLIGIIASFITGVKKRIYTRHNSTLFHMYYPASVKYDKLINILSTNIVSISNAVSEVLTEWEKVPLEKIVLIPHGFDFSCFENISLERVNNVRERNNIKDSTFVIGVISRFIAWKGIEYIITSFKDFINKYPDAILILANAKGPDEKKILKELESLPSENYRVIPFETDVFALYKIFDVFVHVPIDKYCEAYGQVYIESLASNVPSIFTLSGIANEFVENRKNAIVVNYKNSDDIYNALYFVYNNRDAVMEMASKGKKDVIGRYDFKEMISKLEELYSK